MTALFTSDDLRQAAMQAGGGTMTRPFHATGVSIDSRTVQPGDLFVALRTESGDGHDHVAAALARGAAGALVQHRHGMGEDAALMIVGDTLAGLTALGAFARARFTGSVVAITGSVGKTTTKEMLKRVLSASARTHAAVASYNNQWGVPLTLARMPPDAAYGVIEIGMNHRGEIAPLAMLARPHVAVITAVGSAHIGHMGSLDAIADEKASIARGVLPGGAIVLPRDTTRLDRLRAPADGLRILYFGQDNLQHCRQDQDGSDIAAVIDGQFITFRVGAPGRHMAMNALAALTAADALGADIALGAQALAGFTPVGGRGTRRPILNASATLLDESYNASVDSVRAALTVLKLMPADRRIAVLGDMLELGEHSAGAHGALADAVIDSADILFTCGPWMKILHDAVPRSLRGLHAADSQALASIVADAVRPGDAVLVKGSLGSRMARVVDALLHTTPGRG